MYLKSTQKMHFCSRKISLLHSWQNPSFFKIYVYLKPTTLFIFSWSITEKNSLKRTKNIQYNNSKKKKNELKLFCLRWTIYNTFISLSSIKKKSHKITWWRFREMFECLQMHCNLKFFHFHLINKKETSSTNAFPKSYGTIIV